VKSQIRYSISHLLGLVFLIALWLAALRGVDADSRVLLFLLALTILVGIIYFCGVFVVIMWLIPSALGVLRWIRRESALRKTPGRSGSIRSAR
jgi:hypothetical protein